MKINQRGHINTVGLAIGAVCLAVFVGLIYRYQHDLRRYQMGPKSVIRSSSVVRAYPAPKMMKRPIKFVPWQPGPTRYRIIGSLNGRRIVQKVMPTYPSWAEKDGISTQVQLAFRVDDAGRVSSNISVVKMGQPDFNEAAIQALKQWKFSPSTRPSASMPHPDILREAGRGEAGVINFIFTLPPPTVRT